MAVLSIHGLPSMSRFLGCAAALFLVCSEPAAQIILIRDQVSLQPMAGVAAQGTKSRTLTLSNADGMLDPSAFSEQDSIRFTHLGYDPVVKSRTDLLYSNTTLYLSPRTFGLEEFVVSANRFREPKRDVAERIDVIDTRTIGLLDQPTTGDLLQNSGTVFVQKSQAGGGSPVIRGFEASRVLLVVDGIRMNNAIYRSGHLQDIMTVDQNALDRAEVISGPASVVYGSDALGGVVHLITRSAAFNDTVGLLVHGGAFARYASANNERTAHLDLSLATRRSSSFTSITASDFDDLRQGGSRTSTYPTFGRRDFHVERRDGTDHVIVNPVPDVQVGTAYKQLDVLEKIRLRTGTRTVHQLNMQLSTSSDLPRYDRLSEFSLDSMGATVPAQAEWYYGPQQRVLMAYSLELEKRRPFDEAHITSAYQHIEQSRHTRAFGSSRLGSRWEQVAVLSLNADFEKRIKRHEVRYGVEWYHNEVASRAERRNLNTGEVGYLTTRYPNGGSSMVGSAVYVTHTLEVNDHWILSDGVRYNHVDLHATFADEVDHQFLNGDVQQRNGAFNWRLGAVYSPGSDWRFTALGSTGFRAPNVDDMGKVFDSTPGTVMVPNPTLGPERTLNAEVGVGKTFCKVLTVEATAFHTWFRDALLVRDFRSNGHDSIDYDGTLCRVTALTNAGKAYITGGSGSLSARWGAHITLKSSLTYTFGRVRTDSTDAPLDHIPPVFGRTSVSLQVKRLQAEAYALYNGWKHLEDYSTSGEDNARYATLEGMPAWYTVNARASLAITEHLLLQWGVENILDRNYRTFASGISAAGRNVQLSIRASF